jgi:hypothetical protein
MKLLITLFLIISPGLLIAQKTYEPIDKMGWEIPVISDLDIDPEKDLGSVTYLLEVDKNGAIKKVKMLSSTFSEAAELKVRDHVKNIKLSRRTEKGKIGYKGTLEISLDLCRNVKD